MNVLPFFCSSFCDYVSIAAALAESSQHKPFAHDSPAAVRSLLILIKRENCWSKLKEFLRANVARTYKELDSITEAINTRPKILLQQSCMQVLASSKLV